MGWGEPRLLLLVVAVAALACLRAWWGAASRRARAPIGAGIPALTPRIGRRREALRQVLGWSGLALAAVAMAQPRWGAGEQLRRQTGADLLVCVDCSRSMLAKDLYPDRMHVARRKALDLLALAPETRMALLPFAAVAILRCPLTGDHQALAQMLDDCSPDLFPAEHGYQGTAIGGAVEEGLRMLDRQVERGQAVLIISDGADPDAKEVAAAAQRAQAQGVPVYGLFVGDAQRTVEVDIDGQQHAMPAERGTLDELARATGAITVNATSDDADVRALHEHLQATVAQTPWEERHQVVQSERYRWALVPATLLIAAAFLLPTRRRLRAEPA